MRWHSVLWRKDIECLLSGVYGPIYQSLCLNKVDNLLYCHISEHCYNINKKHSCNNDDNCDGGGCGANADKIISEIVVLQISQDPYEDYAFILKSSHYEAVSMTCCVPSTVFLHSIVCFLMKSDDVRTADTPQTHTVPHVNNKCFTEILHTVLC